MTVSEVFLGDLVRVARNLSLTETDLRRAALFLGFDLTIEMPLESSDANIPPKSSGEPQIRLDEMSPEIVRGGTNAAQVLPPCSRG